MVGSISSTIDEDNEDENQTLKPTSAAEKAAATYAWEYFKYHAQQRQAVFRFYLILIGAVFALFAASYSPQQSEIRDLRWIFGLLFMLISFLFWRLDVRSFNLVKLAERYIVVDEQRLSRILDRDEIKIISSADRRKNTAFIMRPFTTFRQVYRMIFLINSAFGLFIIYKNLPTNVIVGWLNLACSVGSSN